MSISQIKSKKIKASQFQIVIFEHIILTLLSFLGSFLFIFYVFGKSESKASLRGFDNYQPLTYLLENENSYYLICMIITLIANFFILFKKSKNIAIYKIEFNDFESLLKIDFKKRYSDKINQFKIKYDEINYSLGKRELFPSSNELNYIKLYHFEKFVGEIHLGDLLWDKDYQAYRTLKAKLKEINAVQHVVKNIADLTLIEKMLHLLKINRKR